MPILTLENVVASYIPGVEILRGVNLCVGQGEIVCLVGPNGAGKSTVLRTISGFLRPSMGSINFNGRAIGGMSPEHILQLGITHVPQGHSVFAKMTVRENLLLGAFTVKDKSVIARRLERVYELFPFLKERLNDKAGNLSGGQQKILEIGRALMLEPPLMILDEPSLGLAPRTMDTLFNTIKDLNKNGLTILMVEQNARQVSEFKFNGARLELYLPLTNAGSKP